MREVTKEIKFVVGGQEKTFQLRKMNALAGSTLIKFCAEKLLPVYNSLQEIFTVNDVNVEGLSEEEIKGKEEQLSKERTERILQMIPAALEQIPEKEMIMFETKCLQTVDVLKKAGWQPVMIGERFGDEDLEYDIGATLRLVYEVLAFNLGSFFGEGSLLSLLNRQNSSLPSA